LSICPEIVHDVKNSTDKARRRAKLFAPGKVSGRSTTRRDKIKSIEYRSLRKLATAAGYQRNLAEERETEESSKNFVKRLS
jgi:hypothetical protein